MPDKEPNLKDYEFWEQLDRLEVAFGVKLQDGKQVGEWYQAIQWMHAGRLRKLVGELIKRHEKWPRTANVAGMLTALNKIVPYSPNPNIIETSVAEVLERVPMPEKWQPFWQHMKQHSYCSALEAFPALVLELYPPGKPVPPEYKEIVERVCLKDVPF
jgi:hypothetical protein